MPKSRSIAVPRRGERSSTSWARTVLAALLVLAGIGWVCYYDFFVLDDGTPKAIFELGSWNFLIGFGAMFLGLALAAHRSTPLGRGRGVVIGMLGCFVIGLIWIVVYYVTSQSASIPIFSELGNYNLLVGIGFMAVGFIYATKWE